MPQPPATSALPPPPTLVVYHSPCPDGFAAAWSYWKRYGAAISYIPFDHGDPLPDLRGHDVVMVDIGPRRAIALQAHAQARSFRILDHHASAHDDLFDLPFAHFDLLASGASMAWRDAHPGTPLPRLITCIEDRDMQRGLMPGGDLAGHVLDSLPYSFEAWDLLATRMENDWEGVLAEGRMMQQRFDALADRMLRRAIPITQDGLSGLAVNAPLEFAPHVGLRLAQHADFAFTWYLDGKSQVRGSWRSNGVDVIRLAEQYGGGGHPFASGARLSIADLAGLLCHPAISLPKT